MTKLEDLKAARDAANDARSAEKVARMIIQRRNKMTKLEELKAARDAANAARDAANAAEKVARMIMLLMLLGTVLMLLN